MTGVRKPVLPPPNNALERTAGSHSLAAAAQRGRWAADAVGIAAVLPGRRAR
jgi:hypothetical protein